MHIYCYLLKLNSILNYICGIKGFILFKETSGIKKLMVTVFGNVLLLGVPGSPWALEPRPSQIPRSHPKGFGPVTRINSRKQNRADGWVTQAGKLIKAKSPLLRYKSQWPLKGVVGTLGVGFLSFYWQLLTRGQNIYYLEWEAGFLLFLPNSIRGFLSRHLSS